jgi:hypothetical protein
VVHAASIFRVKIQVEVFSVVMPCSLMVDFRRGQGIFLFTTASRRALGPTQPPFPWVPGALSLGVERPGCEADHSPPGSAKVKNVWRHTSTPQYAFMAWCSVIAQGIPTFQRSMLPPSSLHPENGVSVGILHHYTTTQTGRHGL